MVRQTLDKHNVKLTIATLVTVVIFIVATTFSLATWKADLEHKNDAVLTELENHIEWGNNEHKHIDHFLASLESRQDDSDIAMVRVETKLASIESLLIEIKEDLHKHD